MKCANCGADIPAGMLICPDCGTEVQMVPDYNPLDDVLTREVKGSVEDVTRPLPNSSGQVQQQRNRSRQQPQNSTRVLSQGELDRIRSNQMRTSQKSNYRGRDTVGEERIRPTGRDTRAQQTDYRTADERRRQKALRMQQAKKKRRNTMIVVMVILVAVGISGILLYQNSYSGTLNKAEKAYQSSEYSKAIRYYNLAIAKDNTRATAYVGLSKVYIAQDELDKAENMFLNAIDSQPENADLYEALAQFYIKTDQADKISGTLDGSSKNVLKEMSDYVSDMPEFSLEEGTYTEVQQVSLSGNGKIYYTTDGNEPTTDSTLYTEPILIEDGTVVIKAICVKRESLVWLQPKHIRLRFQLKMHQLLHHLPGNILLQRRSVLQFRKDIQHIIQWIIQHQQQHQRSTPVQLTCRRDRRFFLRFLSTRMEKQHRSQKEIMY